MPLILPCNVASATAATGYDVANSCRFNDDDSAYLSRTQSSGSTTKFTYSAWMKRGKLSDAQDFLDVYDDNDNRFGFFWSSEYHIDMYNKISGSVNFQKITTAKYRDPSAWYHAVVAVDTTQGTAANRVKIFINGVQETSLSVANYPAENFDVVSMASGKEIGIGNRMNGNSRYFDGYLAEVVFCDGQVYGPTDFGEFDEDSPTIWKPKDVSGLTFGTNGFYLDFEDSSNLGNDANGGTDLTETNLAAADQATDTPTNNFCTINPLDTHASATLSEGNTGIATTASGWFGGSGTIGITLGQPAYFEAKAISSARLYFGLSRIGQGVRGTCLNSSAEGSSDFDYMWRTTTANNVFYGGASQSITIAAISANDICACSVASDGEVIFYVNDSVVVTFSTKLVAGYFYFPILAANAYGGGTESWQANFGNPAYAITSTNTDPDGYGNFEFATKSAYAINTKNLAEYG